MRRHLIKITPSGYGSLESLSDKKVRREIGKAIDGLRQSPEFKGKALEGELEDCRSIRAYRNLYRIVYKIEGEIVWVVLVGLRKAGHEEDIYAKVKRLMKIFLD